MRASRRNAIMLAAGATVFTVAMSGCVPNDAPASTTESSVLKIGLLAQMTGNSAADGLLMQQGAQLAIDEINADGGILGRTVELVTEDVQDQVPDRVSAAVTSLVNDPDVELVVGGYPSSTNFEVDLLAEADMPYLIGGNSDQTAGIVSKNPDAYPTIWSFSPSFEGYSTELPASIEALAKDGALTLRNQKTYIVSNDSPYSNGIADGLTTTFTDLGWSVTGPEVIPTGQVNDWGSQLQKVRELDPDVVINTDYQTSNGATFLDQFRQQPTNSLLFIQYAPSVPEFLELTGENANGLLYNLIGGPILSDEAPLSVEVRDAFTDAYGTDPGVYGAALYEMVKSYQTVAEKVGDPDDHIAIGEEYGSSTFETGLGTVAFDPETHLAKAGDDFVPVQLFQILDGERVLISPAKYANGEFVLPEWMTP